MRIDSGKGTIAQWSVVACNINHLNRPGRGALVRHGEFWYPARVVQREGLKYWRVRWWRECQFAEGGIKPGSLASISIDDIVDSLWLKRAERRKIRVSNTYVSLDSRDSPRRPSLENGHIHIIFQHRKTSSPTLRLSPTQMKSTKHLNRIGGHLLGCSPPQTVSTAKCHRMSYPQRSGLLTMPNPSKKPLFHTLGPYLSLRGHKSPTGSKDQSA